MSDQLTTEVREKLGTTATRRLRQAGKVPAVLYGHGGESVSLTLASDQVASVLRHGGRFVSLSGAVSEDALIKEIQWDPFGDDVLHLDLARVVKGEKAEVTVPTKLRGNAPGASEGGIVEHVLHEIQLSSFVSKIPERIDVNINELGLGQTITAGDLELPEGSELIGDADAVIAQCNAADDKPEDEEAATAAPGEPEVIGAKKDDDEDGEGEG